MESEIELEVKALTTCAYSNATFTEILNRIQKAVDNLSLHAYSNLQQWVARLDQRVSYRIQKAVDNLSLHAKKQYQFVVYVAVYNSEN
jgi:dynein heavy chain 1